MGENRKLDPDLVEAANLTRRQAECLELHLRGASLRYIGRQLGIDHRTAQEHIEKATAKLSAVIA